MKNLILAISLVGLLAACGSDEAPPAKAPESMPAKMEMAAPETGMTEMDSDMEDTMPAEDAELDAGQAMSDEAADDAGSIADQAMDMAQDVYEEAKDDPNVQEAMDNLQQQAKDAAKSEMDDLMKP